MIRNIIITFAACSALLVAIHYFHQEEPYNLKLENLKQQYAKKKTPSSDHTKYPELNRRFATPQKVTEACIKCHTERPKEVIASSHWNWERVAYIEGRGIEFIGKRNLLNNFCIGANTNEQACAKCHVGFGMTDDHFDFNNAVNVDCMVCHDNSEEYQKGSAMAGYPARTVNLTQVARSVGPPHKSNCGACHFYGGGGNNVKHGDLEEALLDCQRDVDVHMAANGLDMQCVDCHTAQNHNMKGKLYSVSSENINRSTCRQCHTANPHFSEILNRHFARVACQTCHIPQYAKVKPTKMSWKWSDAGSLKDGQPYQTTDPDGNVVYLSKKGTFEWRKNALPEYVWFNGTADHYILGDSIASVPVQMNTLNGGPLDPESKIIPVKVHRGDQIFDKKYNRLVQPKLFSKSMGDSAYWMDFNWRHAAETGMKRVGLPFSGDFGFVGTEMYWPVNHMVSPKEQALACVACHTRDNGRLQKLTGFYMPGRDRNRWLDGLGFLLIAGSILGVFAHAALRGYFAVKSGGKTIEVE